MHVQNSVFNYGTGELASAIKGFLPSAKDRVSVSLVSRHISSSQMSKATGKDIISMLGEAISDSVQSRFSNRTQAFANHYGAATRALNFDATEFTPVERAKLGFVVKDVAAFINN